MTFRTILFLALLTRVPFSRVADIVYSNGPFDGNTWAWGINYDAVVSDTFNIASDSSTISGANFAMWIFPGDRLYSAELLISSAQFGGGTIYFDQVVTFTQSDCIYPNNYGFDVCQESAVFNGPALNRGTYWLSLRNATASAGDPVYWDQNSGPSRAVQCCERYEPVTNAIGPIPSESFTVLGGQ